MKAIKLNKKKEKRNKIKYRQAIMAQPAVGIVHWPKSSVWVCDYGNPRGIIFIFHFFFVKHCKYFSKFALDLCRYSILIHATAVTQKDITSPFYFVHSPLVLYVLWQFLHSRILNNGRWSIILWTFFLGKRSLEPQ